MNSKNTYIYIFHTQFRYCSYALCDVAFVLFTLIYWLHVCLLGARVSHWAKKGKKVPFNFVQIEKDKMIIKTTLYRGFQLFQLIVQLRLPTTLINFSPTHRACHFTKKLIYDLFVLQMTILYINKVFTVWVISFDFLV